MARASPPATTAREWCGTPIPPEIPTLPHPANLRIVRPLPGWVRGFRAVLCVLLALMSVPAGVAMPPIGALMLVVVVYFWTRPARVTITSPLSGSIQIAQSVVLDVSETPDGWSTLLRYSTITLAETERESDRDCAVARLLPLANTIRREMGDSPLLPSP